MSTWPWISFLYGFKILYISIIITITIIIIIIIIIVIKDYR